MKSILIIGAGKMGASLGNKLLSLGNEVVIADISEDTASKLTESYTDIFIGDCTNESVLRSLGVNNFDICFVTVGENFQSSLEITSILSELNAKYIVSKGNSERQCAMLKKLGANEVIFAEKEVAEKAAVRFNAENIFDCIELTDEYSIFEIPVRKEWVGLMLAEADVRKNYLINVIAIKKEGKMIPMPTAEYVFCENDHLVVIGKSTDVFKAANDKNIRENKIEK